MTNPEDTVIDLSMDILNASDDWGVFDFYDVEIKLNEIQLTRTEDNVLFKITVETVDAFDY